MKKIIFTSLILIVFCNISFHSFSAPSDDIKPVWQSKLNSLNVFIENKGQFIKPKNSNEEILFGYLGSHEKYFFTKNGIIIQIDKIAKKKNMAVFIESIFSNESKEELEKENLKTETYFINAIWQNTNDLFSVETDEQSEGYFTFGKNSYTANSYKKLIYKNIYPGIDIEYIIPNDSTGIKYSLIVHPGGDLKQAKLKYSGKIKDLILTESGNIIIKTPAWDITEYNPVSHNEGVNTTIKTNFILDDKTISFDCPEGYDSTKVLVVDPWVTGITISANNVAYDADYDFNSNLYVYVRDLTPGWGIYISKYSSTGALLWTSLSTSTSDYDGNFLVDKTTGKVYISEGWATNGAYAYRLAQTGIADGWASQIYPDFDEIWNMGFDCSTNSILALGGGTVSNITGGIINTTTGAVTGANFTGYAGPYQDIVSYAINTQGRLFTLFASGTETAVNNHLILVNPALNGPTWNVPTGYMTFSEAQNHRPTNASPNNPYFGGSANNFNALAINDNYLYYYDGTNLAAYNPANGAMVCSTQVSYAGITYTPREQGGIDVDDCDNIYIGGPNGNILYYHFTGSAFNQIGSLPLGWSGVNQKVFDIKYDRTTNYLFVAGYGNTGVYTAPLSCSCSLLTDTTICNGGNNGTATVTLNTLVTNPLVSYIWQNISGTTVSQTLNSSSLSNSVPGLTNGTYIVLVQLNAPCGPLFLDTVIVDCPTCGANVTTTPVSCFGGADGTASVTPSGIGVAPFTYNWSPAPASGQGTPNVSGLTAITYSVVVTDSNNCSATASDTVNQPTAVVAIITASTNLLCFGTSTGSATASASGGTVPYTYLWNDPAPAQTTITATGLSTGTWSVQVTDSNSCTTTAMVTITQPALLNATIPTHTNVSCFNGSDGTATASATGGTGGTYTYLWNDPVPAQTSITAIGLSAGTWTVQVTDSNSCTTNAIVTITQPALLNATIPTHTNVSCFSGNDGIATVSATGGTGAYTYLWNDPAPAQTSITATGLSIGTWTVLVTDSNSCTTTAIVTITQPALLNATIPIHTNVSCFNGSDGTATASATGGTGFYSYLWNNHAPAQTAITATGLTIGTWTVLVTDANTCSDTANVVISEPMLLAESISSLTDITCYGGNDGAASVNVNGGTPPYTYTWAANPLINSNSITTLSAGNSIVAVADTNGCVVTIGFALTEPQPLIISTSPNVTICHNGSTTLAITATGGTFPYSYFWNNQTGASTLVVNPVATSTYLANVEDANGCNSATSIINVTVLPPVDILATSLIDSICPNESTEIFISAFNGNGGPYTLTMPDGTIITSPYTVTLQATQQYTFTATDGCNSTAIDSVIIYVYPIPPINIIADKYDGCTPLKVQFHETSLNVGQSYLWNFGSPDENNLSFAKNPIHIFDIPGSYDITLIVTSAEGCKSSFTISDMIIVYPLPDARFTYNPINPTILNPKIEFTNLSSGNVGNYWSFGDGDSSLILNPTHIYKQVGDYPVTLIAITDKGCRATVIQIVKISDVFTFYAPTAFSPDNDGKNDKFYVYASGIDETNFNLMIYDRWGELIFKANNILTGWDGKVKGEMSQVGTYAWFASFKDFLKNQKTQAGKVTLIR